MGTGTWEKVGRLFHCIFFFQSRNMKILKYCRKSLDAVCSINLYKDILSILNQLNPKPFKKIMTF